MKPSHVILILLLAMGAGYLGARLAPGAPPTTTPIAEKHETTYDRVMRTGKIRCGWGVWDPIIMKDPNTGEFSGIFYDYMEEVAKLLNLKIEWSEEIGWGEFGAALESNRIDAMCTGIWPIGQRARAMDFTIPIYYHAMHAYVRADDTRFDDNIDLANNEDITFSGQDGLVGYEIALKRFPKAKKHAIPQMAEQTQVLFNVATGKADIVIADRASAMLYLEKNPGALRQVEGIEPLNLLGNTVAIKSGEDEFRRMLDNATRDLIHKGVVGKIIQKYEKYPNSIYPVAKPYETQ